MPISVVRPRLIKSLATLGNYADLRVVAKIGQLVIKVDGPGKLRSTLLTGRAGSLALEMGAKHKYRTRPLLRTRSPLLAFN